MVFSKICTDIEVRGREQRGGEGRGREGREALPTERKGRREVCELMRYPGPADD